MTTDLRVTNSADAVDTHSFDDAEHTVEHRIDRADIIRIGIVGIASALVWFRVWEPISSVSVIGIAMGSGTNVARESANVMLLGNDLLKFVETLKIAQRSHRIIMANFAGTLMVDGAGVALAAFGFLNRLLAAFIHVSSELAFILNSARLLPGRSR